MNRSFLSLFGVDGSNCGVVGREGALCVAMVEHVYVVQVVPPVGQLLLVHRLVLPPSLTLQVLNWSMRMEHLQLRVTADSLVLAVLSPGNHLCRSVSDVGGRSHRFRELQRLAGVFFVQGLLRLLRTSETFGENLLLSADSLQTF